MPVSDSARKRPKPVRCCFKGQEGASWNQEGAFYGQERVAEVAIAFKRLKVNTLEIFLTTLRICRHSGRSKQRPYNCQTIERPSRVSKVGRL